MRIFTTSLLALALTGCATHPANVCVAPAYAPAPAAVLAFDPPVLAGTPRLDLSREDRGTSAFVGFADSSTTYYFLQTNDCYDDAYGYGNGCGQGGANREQYQRQAISETYGVIHH